MIFVNGINKEDTYSLYDVFGRDEIFYKSTTVRKQGWETNASIFYIRDNKLRIRFKKVLEPFYNSYQDPPFVGDPNFLFYDMELMEYNSKEPFRRMEYAIEQFKATNESFSISPLLPKEIEEKLSDADAFIGPEFSFENEISFSDFYNTSCFFFPVDINVFLTDFLNRNSFCHDEAMLVYWNGNTLHGHLGYDGNFYRTDVFPGHNDKPQVYSIKNGIEKIMTPEWLSDNNLSYGYTFLRKYIVRRDNNCFAYSGEYLDDRTRHHKNVKLLNDIIRLLYKDYPKGYSDTLYSQLVVPREFVDFDVASIESVVVPHLESKGALNRVAWKHLKSVISILEKVGLSTNFECAFRNILDLNKSKIYGGSKRNICGEQLYENLRKLNKKVRNDRMAFLLENKVELKIEVAKINKTNVVEIFVSEEAFSTIKSERKVPKELKDNSKWTSLQAGAFVVFSNKITNERFCAITTNTKSGLSLNRV